MRSTDTMLQSALAAIITFGISFSGFAHPIAKPTYLCDAGTISLTASRSFWGNESPIQKQANDSALANCKSNLDVPTSCQPLECFSVVGEDFGYKGLIPLNSYPQSSTMRTNRKLLATLPNDQLLKLAWGPELNKFMPIGHCYLMHELLRDYESYKKRHGAVDYYFVSVKAHANYPDTLTSPRHFFKNNDDTQALQLALDDLREFLSSGTCDQPVRRF